MRLIDTETGQFIDKDPEDDETIYAILSHTWDTEKAEQTYEELRNIQERCRSKVRISESGPGGPNAGASSSPEQPEGGPPPTHSPPSQLPSDLVSVNSGTLLITSTEPTKSWIIRKMARLKRLFQRHPARSARNGPQPPSDSPSVMACPLTAIGGLTRLKVEGLVHAIGKVCYLVTPTPKSIWDDAELSPKIRDACIVARKNGYRYIWIDSCCIDKSSSSELSEAINSMYKWYSRADVCYVHLADVPLGDDHHAEDSRFRKSRWFTRGWTLQELIAPVNVEFLSQYWAPIGWKHALVNLVESITGINHRALLHMEPVNRFSVAQRFSWTARRKTTRKEDMAYSLLGIFDINMPTLYGEGNRAFQRLQEQIMQSIPDQSLFAWGEVYLPDSPQLPENQIPIHSSITLGAVECESDQSLSARSPYDFRKSGNIRNIQLPASLHYEIGYVSTPYGIRTQFQMIPLTPDLLLRILSYSEVKLGLWDDSHRWYLAILGCEHTEYPGYLLGRVCYVPASESGVEFVRAGYIDFDLTKTGVPVPNLFFLSPNTVEHFRPHLKLKTVYIPHPNPANQRRSLRDKPYSTIKLVLLTETYDALRSRGYRADLRGPDPDHPTADWLTLSNDEHIIIATFQHTLRRKGRELTINAAVKVSGSHVQPNSAVDSDQPDRHAVSCQWMDDNIGGWKTTLGPETVKLSAAGSKTLTVDLSLDFGGNGFYYVRVKVRSGAPPVPANVDSALPAPPAVEWAGEKAKEAEVTGDDLHSGAVDTEDSETGREVEAGGHGMTSVDVGRVEEIASETADREVGGGSA